MNQSADTIMNKQIKSRMDNESYGSRVKVDERSRADVKALQTLEKTTQCDNGRYTVDMLWNSFQLGMPNRFRSAVRQSFSLENRLERNSEIKRSYSETIRTDEDSGYIRKLNTTPIQKTNKSPQWYGPHHSVINASKPRKARRVCSAANEIHEQSLNKSLLIGPDLLQNLIGILIRFREKFFGMSAVLEAMSLQVKVHADDAKCLRFLQTENQADNLSPNKYTRHIFGANDSPTCAIYALQ